MSHSNLPDDVDLSHEWRRSSLCAASGCVEISASEGVIRVRDSKHPDSPILTFDADEWQAFVASVKDREFDA